LIRLRRAKPIWNRSRTPEFSQDLVQERELQGGDCAKVGRPGERLTRIVAADVDTHARRCSGCGFPEGRHVTEAIEVEPFFENGLLSTPTLFEYRDGKLVQTAARRPRVLDLVDKAGLAFAWEPPA
jgi:hypothetical protein